MSLLIIDIFLSNKFYLLLIVQLGFFLVWKHFLYKFFLNNNSLKQIQDTHDISKNIPRIGGLSIFISLLFFIDLNSYFSKILLAFIPLFCITFVEDLLFKLSPKFRLFIIVLSSFLCIYYALDNFPVIEFPFIGEFFFNNYYFNLLFFVFALAGLTNGMNLIDGSNGLAALTSLSTITSIAFLSYISSDYLMLEISCLFFLSIILFLFFNFPLGKIFLGDLGAYFLGFFLGAITIIFYSRHPEIPSWGAVLLLFYPTMEMVFSFTRKLLSKKNPMLPDNKHLHIKLHFILKKSLGPSLAANNLIVPFLALLWLSPAIIIPWVYLNVFFILIWVLFLIVCYLFFYYSLPLLDEK